MIFINVLLENFYGEGEPNNRFFSMLIEKLKRNETIDLTEGYQRRDIIYVGDVVNAIIELSRCDFLINEDIYEIPVGSGENPTIREIVCYLKEILNSSSVLKFGAIKMRDNEPNTCSDLTKLKKLGINIKYNWQEGLRKIVENK